MINTSVTNEATSESLNTSSSVCNILLYTKYVHAKWFNYLFKVEKNRYGNNDNHRIQFHISTTHDQTPFVQIRIRIYE